MCCTILPPTDLLHPVLPYRCSQKVTFPLCDACVSQYIDAPLLGKNVDDCRHIDAQRALTGTWCTPKLAVVLKKGYRLLHIHQIYHFPDRQVGLFAEDIDTWLKLKEEASGYPSIAPQDTLNAGTSNDGRNAKTSSSTVPTSAKIRVNVLWLNSC